MRRVNGGPRVSGERTVVRLALAVVASLAVACKDATAGTSDERAERPNIVLLLVDDLRADTLSFAGHPVVETPHIDRLAREGARFDNSFVATSLCCPSRATLLTGLYAHQHGVTSNLEGDLDPTLDTFPKLLRAAGYETAFVGKWHMGEGAEPRPGFDHWVSFEGQGTYEDPVLFEDGKEARVEGYVTDVLTDRATEWIAARDGSAPFCLILSHKAVHTPMTPAARHAGRYADAELTPPPSVWDDLSGKPEALRRYAMFGALTVDLEEHANDTIPPRVDTEGWIYGQYLPQYLETILSVDDSVGRVLAALDEHADERVAKNTVVVFASDNGYLFGEHRRYDKRLAWEESIRVPLVVRAPGRVAAGTVVDELVLNVDVAPTLLELAGVESPSPMSGASLVPLMRGEDASWRERIFYSYFRERRTAGAPTLLAVRDARWKYVFYPESLAPDEELYDLAADPNELVNLASVEAHAETLARMRAALADEMRATGFAYPEHARPPTFEPCEREVLLAITPDAAPSPDAVVALAGRSFDVEARTPAAPTGPLLAVSAEDNGFALGIEETERGRAIVMRVTSGGRVRRAELPIDAAPRAALAFRAGLDRSGRAFVTMNERTVRAPLAFEGPLRDVAGVRLDPAFAGATLTIVATGTR